jgi:hypothetical protein
MLDSCTYCTTPFLLGRHVWRPSILKRGRNRCSSSCSGAQTSCRGQLLPSGSTPPFGFAAPMLYGIKSVIVLPVLLYAVIFLALKLADLHEQPLTQIIVRRPSISAGLMC